MCVCVFPDGGRDTRCDQSASHDSSFVVVVVVIVVVVWYTRASPERWSDGWMGGTPHFTSLRFAESSRVESRERPVESGTRVCSCVCVRVFVRARGKKKNGDSVEEDLVSFHSSYILNLKS